MATLGSLPVVTMPATTVVTVDPAYAKVPIVAHQRLFSLSLGGQSHTLQHNKSYTIGSAEAANICLSVKTVAPLHAKVFNNELTVLEGATAGVYTTLFNGRAILPGAHETIVGGDRLTLGAQEFVFTLLTAEQSAAQWNSNAPRGVAHEQPTGHAIVTPGAAAVLGAGIQDKDHSTQQHLYSQTGDKHMVAKENITAPTFHGTNEPVAIINAAAAVPVVVAAAAAQPTFTKSFDEAAAESLSTLKLRNATGGDPSGVKFMASELVQMFRDMSSLGGSPLDERADARLPHLIALLPLSMRKELGSSELKNWLHHAETQRSLRLTGGAPDATSSSALASQNRNALTEQDLTYGLLASVGEDSTKRYPSSAPAGAARFNNDQLGTVMRDLLDVSGEKLSPEAQLSMPRMLSHLPTSFRSSFASPELKAWIQRAQAQRSERGHVTTDHEKTLSENDLLFALVGLHSQLEEAKKAEQDKLVR